MVKLTLAASEAPKFAGSPPRRGRPLTAFLWQQTLLGIAINAFIPTAIIRALNVVPPATIWGARGVLPGMILASGLATLLMTLAVTAAVRGSLRRKPLDRCSAPLSRWLIRLPGNVVARAVTLSGLAMLSIVPFFLGVIAAFPILPLSNHGFVLWNLIYGATVGATMTPIAVLRAIADMSMPLHAMAYHPTGDHLHDDA